MTGIDAAPRAFMSYAWEDDDHQAWVLQLATRLRSNGVDVVLDVWDTRLGSDLAFFMESGITSADRVIVICSDQYVAKANAPMGGVGYEKKMLTPRLMNNLGSELVIPVIRNRSSSPKMPSFLGAAKYIDFLDDTTYEERYAVLIHDIHGRQIQAVPPLGQNPFNLMPQGEVSNSLRDDGARYVSPAISGRVTFNYTNNSGNYVIGSGDMVFTVSLSTAGPGAIHLYRDPADIIAIALAPHISTFAEVQDAGQFDSSSRSRTIREGDAAVLRNASGYYAVILIDRVVTRDTALDGQPQMDFRYSIQPNRSALFS